MGKTIAFVLLLAFTYQVGYGQRHLKGQLALTPFVGVVDNLPTAGLQANGQGLAVGLDLTRYTSRETYWKVAYLYDVKYYNQLDARLTTDRHTISVDYALITLHDKRRHFYVAPQIGAHVGFERVNNNELELAAGRILNQPSGLVGLQAGVEAEIFILERTALVLGVQERYMPYSSVSLFRTYGTVGLRFSFFKN